VKIAANISLMFTKLPMPLRVEAARLGLSPERELERLLPLVKHVQFADAPGRHEPGTGEIDFKPILHLLCSRSYAGWIGAEYRPAGRTASALGWLAAWRRTLRREP